MSNLRKIRETMRVSQAVLAEKVGCTQGAIGHYESGRRHTSSFVSGRGKLPTGDRSHLIHHWCQ